MGNRKGFTLLELLIGLVILSVGLLALAQMQLVAIKRNSFAQKLTQATVLAQGKLESLIGMGYAQVTASDPQPETLSGGFTRTWSKQNNVPSNGMVTVTVSCSWNDERGNPHSVSISTIIAQ